MLFPGPHAIADACVHDPNIDDLLTRMHMNNQTEAWLESALWERLTGKRYMETAWRAFHAPLRRM